MSTKVAFLWSSVGSEISRAVGAVVVCVFAAVHRIRQPEARPHQQTQQASHQMSLGRWFIVNLRQSYLAAAGAPDLSRIWSETRCSYDLKRKITSLTVWAPKKKDSYRWSLVAGLEWVADTVEGTAEHTAGAGRKQVVLESRYCVHIPVHWAVLVFVPFWAVFSELLFSKLNQTTVSLQVSWEPYLITFVRLFTLFAALFDKHSLEQSKTLNDNTFARTIASSVISPLFRNKLFNFNSSVFTIKICSHWQLWRHKSDESSSRASHRQWKFNLPTCAHEKCFQSSSAHVNERYTISLIGATQKRKHTKSD